MNKVSILGSAYRFTYQMVNCMFTVLICIPRRVFDGSEAVDEQWQKSMRSDDECQAEWKVRHQEIQKSSEALAEAMKSENKSEIWQRKFEVMTGKADLLADKTLRKLSTVVNHAYAVSILGAVGIFTGLVGLKTVENILKHKLEDAPVPVKQPVVPKQTSGITEKENARLNERLGNSSFSHADRLRAEKAQGAALKF